MTKHVCQSLEFILLNYAPFYRIALSWTRNVSKQYLFTCGRGDNSNEHEPFPCHNFCSQQRPGTERKRFRRKCELFLTYRFLINITICQSPKCWKSMLTLQVLFFNRNNLTAMFSLEIFIYCCSHRVLSFVSGLRSTCSHFVVRVG